MRDTRVATGLHVCGGATERAGHPLPRAYAGRPPRSDAQILVNHKYPTCRVTAFVGNSLVCLSGRVARPPRRVDGGATPSQGQGRVAHLHPISRAPAYCLSVWAGRPSVASTAAKERRGAPPAERRGQSIRPTRPVRPPDLFDLYGQFGQSDRFGRFDQFDPIAGPTRSGSPKWSNQQIGHTRRLKRTNSTGGACVYLFMRMLCMCSCAYGCVCVCAWAWAWAWARLDRDDEGCRRPAVSVYVVYTKCVHTRRTHTVCECVYSAPGPGR